MTFPLRLAALALCLSAGAAAAQDDRVHAGVSHDAAYTVRTTALRVSDFDLATPDGRAAFEARVSEAAGKVCMDRFDRTEAVDDRADFERCRADAVAGALAAVRGLGHSGRTVTLAQRTQGAQ